MQPKDFKQYKGQLVMLTFAENIISGIIRYNHKKFMVFDVNATGYEITIPYSKIKGIEKIKSKNRL